jgi:hypothetical protein
VRNCLLPALGLLLCNAPAQAEIVVDTAMITAGELRITGRLNPAAAAPVLLDETYQKQTDITVRFDFRLPYHPATCDRPPWGGPG